MEKNKPKFVKYESIIPIDVAKDLKKILEGNKVEVYEKIDGGNCQIGCVNYELYPGSRSKFLKGSSAIGSREWFKSFTDWCYSNSSLYNIPEDKLIFGEWTADHTIDYDSEFRNRFFLIDLFDKRTQRFIPYQSATDFLEEWGVEEVNILKSLAKGKVSKKEIYRLLNEVPSDFYSGAKEGLVLKNYHTLVQDFWKILHPNFEEKRNIDFGRKGQIIANYQEDPKTYLTLHRCLKAYHRLLDEGAEAVSFEDLIYEVRRDIKRERGIDYGSKVLQKNLESSLGEDVEISKDTKITDTDLKKFNFG